MLVHNQKEFDAAVLAKKPIILSDGCGEIVRWDRPTIASIEVERRGATVKGDLYLVGATVEGDVSLSGATVEGDVSLSCATVKGNVSLRGATVKGDLYLVCATVEGHVSLSGATVEGHVSLSGATVKGDVSLSGATVKGGIYLVGATVEGDVSLRGATVKGDWWNPLSYDASEVVEHLRCAQISVDSPSDDRATFERLWNDGWRCIETVTREFVKH